LLVLWAYVRIPIAGFVSPCLAIERDYSLLNLDQHLSYQSQKLYVLGMSIIIEDLD